MPEITIQKTIQCHQDLQPYPLGKCNDCPHKKAQNKEFITCDFVRKQKLIEALPFDSPPWFNRRISEDIGKGFSGYTLFFYTARKQMIPLKHLVHKGFQALKKLVRMREFKEDKVQVVSKSVKFEDVTPVLYLTIHDGIDFDFSVDFNFYKASESKPDAFKATEGEIIYYLYYVFELGGFAQFSILGKPYLAKSEPLRKYSEDLVLVLSKDRKMGVIGNRNI